ncbi:MAG: hypothetical protein ACI9DF_005954 [Verrucomicrobiales bacterium]|jgi:hypothetical protein
MIEGRALVVRLIVDLIMRIGILPCIGRCWPSARFETVGSRYVELNQRAIRCGGKGGTKDLVIGSSVPM